MRRILLFVVLLVAVGAAADEAPALFSYSGPAGGLNAEQARRFAGFRGMGSTLRLRAAEVVAEPRAAQTLRMNLIGSQSYVAVVSKIEEHGAGYTWEGTIEGGGQIVLSVSGTRITGWVWASRARGADRYYSISPLGGRAHVIRQVNQSWFDSLEIGCPVGDDRPPQSLSFDLEEVDSDEIETSAIVETTGSSCLTNILVVYTAAAQAAHGDIPGLAQVAINQTNGSYSNSQVTGLTLNLVGTQQVSYTESATATGGTADDLIRLQGTADGFMDAVHTTRANLGADVVVLFVDNLDPLGIYGQAWQIMATADTAFAIVDWEAAVDNLTFAHELGHLQGARHHWEIDSTTTPYSYGHGSCRRWPYNYKTIMANSYCNESRVPYWSNPDVKYKNRKTGDHSKRNNARVLRETACTVGGFVGPAPLGWNHQWGNNGSDQIHWWYLSTNDRYTVGDFDGDGVDELLAINPNGFAHLMDFANGTWTTQWANIGNHIIHWWMIGPSDSFIAGDFLPGNFRDELLAINPVSGYAHLMVYDGTDWSTAYTNVGSGALHWWLIGGADRYVAGNFIAGNGRDELLAINPVSDYAHLMVFDGTSWSTPWANVGSGAMDWWLIGGADRYVAGNFIAGNGQDELVAINPNGFSHLMQFNGTSWSTPWANVGSGAMHWWLIGGADRYVAGDFVPGDGHDEILAIAPNSNWSQILSYEGTQWQTVWGNNGAGNIGLWYINGLDRFLSGDFIAGDQRDELLSIQPVNGWSQVQNRW